MYKILLLFTIFLAFFLRVYNVGSNPPSVYGDEIAFAWNAYSVMLTGADEYGELHPLQFRSFGDYKSPVPVYLLVPFIRIFDLNAFSIRLVVVLAGTATVAASYLMGKFLGNKKIGLLVAFFMAISPWHTHLSRGFFEATIAQLPFLLGIYFYVSSKGKIWKLILSSISFALSLYTYFTPRVVVPLFILYLLFMSRKQIQIWGVKKLLYFIVIFSIFAMPLIKLTVFDQGLARFTKLQGHKEEQIGEVVNQERATSSLPDKLKYVFHNKAVIWLRQVKNDYLEHFSLNFWFLYGDNSLRYFTGNMGMFYLIDLPFVLLGIGFLLSRRNRIAIFVFFWLLLAPLPTALVGRSFSVRSLAMLPAPFLFTSFGVIYLISEVHKKFLFFSSALLIAIVFLYSFSLGRTLLTYHLEYPNYAATWWGWENWSAIHYGLEREAQYDHIFISDYYSGSALAYAFYGKFDPIRYREAIANPVTIADRKLVNMGKFYFGSLDLDKERLRNGIVPLKTLYIGRPEETDGAGTINTPDNTRILFKIHIFQ